MGYNESMVESTAQREAAAYTAGHSAAHNLSLGAQRARSEVRAGVARRSESEKGLAGTRKYMPGRNGLRANSTLEGEKQNFKENARAMAVKGGPILFWLVAGIAVCKDIIDVFSVILDLVGLGLTATVIGAPIGAPLSILSEIIDKISGLFIDFTIVAYFGYIGGGFALRFMIMSLGAIIDAIPFLDILPLTTVTFFAAYLLGRVAKKAVQIAESGVMRGVQNTARKGMGAAKFIAKYV